MKLFFLFFILLILMPSCSAINVTLSDLDLIGTKKIIVYEGDGTYFGEFNTTDTIQLNNTIDYIFVLKPVPSEMLFRNPLERIVDFATAYSQTVIVITAYCSFVVGIVLLFAYFVRK